MSEENRVLIAGAGPVGLTAALVLAKRGIPVTVFESGDELSRASRASTFHPPTLDLLDQFDGVTNRLIEIGVLADRYQLRDRREGPYAEFDFATLRDDTRHPYRIQCEQSRYTPIALESLRAFSNAEVLFGHAVSGAEVVEDHVEVHVERDGTPVSFRGSWLIGADGASSAVRESLGIGFEGMTYPDRYIVVTTTFDLLEAVPDLAYVNYLSDPREFVVLLRLPDVWRALFPIPSGITDEEATSEASAQRLLTGLADIGEPYPLDHVSLYRVHQRVATTLRRGRALLAGDAAHINNPLGGMGMNSGMHDAFMLADYLAATIEGSRPDSCLDTYADFRRQVATRHVQTISHQNAEQMAEVDEQERLRQHAELARIASDPGLCREYLRERTLITSLEEAAALG
jgi:3-(3-hydroxy-phenyl)propionate hydroxylase